MDDLVKFEVSSNSIEAKAWMGLEEEKTVRARVTATLSDGVTQTSATMSILFAPQIIQVQTLDQPQISQNTTTEVHAEEATAQVKELNFINRPRFANKIAEVYEINLAGERSI